MRESGFFNQADLLVRVLPFVNAEPSFALKGGTAINFFVRDFPRLSVDIDLVYLPVEDKPTTLTGIDTALRGMAARITRAMPNVSVRGCLTSRFRLSDVALRGRIAACEPSNTRRVLRREVTRFWPEGH